MQSCKFMWQEVVFNYTYEQLSCMRGHSNFHMRMNDAVGCPKTHAVSGLPRNFFRGGGGSTNSVEDRGQNGDLGCGSPLVRGSGGICNLVQEIPFHIVKLS